MNSVAAMRAIESMWGKPQAEYIIDAIRAVGYAQAEAEMARLRAELAALKILHRDLAEDLRKSRADNDALMERLKNPYPDMARELLEAIMAISILRDENKNLTQRVNAHKGWLLADEEDVAKTLSHLRTQNLRLWKENEDLKYRSTPRPLSEAPKDGTWVNAFDKGCPVARHHEYPNWEPIQFIGGIWVDCIGEEVLGVEDWVFVPQLPAPTQENEA